MILYLFFLISVLVFGSFIAGPLTLRVWAVMVMFSYLLFSSIKNPVYKNNKYILIYIIFIVFLFLAMTFNGDAETYGLKWIVANHVVSIIVFVATYYVTKDNRQNRMDVIIVALIFILVVNSLVTIAQYFNEPIGWAVSFFFLQGRNEDIVTFQEAYQSLDTLAGVARTPGIFDSSVENGIFLGSFGILPFYFMKRKSWVLKFSSVSLIILSLVACFMCQERAAMLTLGASVLYLSYKSLHNKVWGILVAMIVCAIVLFSVDFSSIDFGRFQEVGMENNARRGIWSYIGPFMRDNLLFGGAEQFVRMSGHLPHNFFFNAFVFGGLIGGITIITLYVMLVWKGYKLLIAKSSSKVTRVLAIAFLAIMAQSLVHNASIITGDVLTFILFGLMIVSVGIKDAESIHIKGKLGNHTIKTQVYGKHS